MNRFFSELAAKAGCDTEVTLLLQGSEQYPVRGRVVELADDHVRLDDDGCSVLVPFSSIAAVN